ncbi:MAG TPA: hypothetical protein VF598_10910, partial [Hymenobacter sp.]
MSEKTDIITAQIKLNIMTNLDGFDIEGTVSKYVIQKILDNAIASVKLIFNDKSKEIEAKVKREYEHKEHEPKEYKKFIEKYDLSIEEDAIINNVIDNINASVSWSKEVGFNFSKRSKKLANVFVDLDLYLTPLRDRVDLDEKLETIKSSEIINLIEKNIIIY